MITTKNHNAADSIEGVLTTFGTYTNLDERIMSDVWASVTYAQYLTAEGEIRAVAVYNSEFPTHGSEYTIDATPAVTEAAKAIKAASALMSEALTLTRRAQEARKSLADVTVKGRTVKITAKRANNAGAEGVVFWAKPGQWGMRLGFKATPTSEPVWTAARNCTVTKLAEGESEADVLALEAEAEEARANAAEAAIKAKADAIAAVAATLEVAPF